MSFLFEAVNKLLKRIKIKSYDCSAQRRVKMGPVQSERSRELNKVTQNYENRLSKVDQLRVQTTRSLRYRSGRS